MPVRDMLGYSIALAAKVAGCSYHTLWREAKLKNLTINPRGFISRQELERWLTTRKTPGRRSKRPLSPSSGSPIPQT